MRRLYEIGVDRQYEAKTPDQAHKAFERTCTLCCTRPGTMPHCGANCPVRTAHEIVMDLKWNIKVEKEQG